MTQPGHKSATLSHLGVAVGSIESASVLYRDVLGLTGMSIDSGDGARVAAMSDGVAFVELLESQVPESPIHKFIERRGPGIHHVCFAVDDLDETLERCRSYGIQLIDETPRRGGEGRRIAFLHPRSTYGVLVELTERSAHLDR